MAEKEEEDFSKLSLEDKLTHKVWKARKMGYEEATKLFRRIDDEKSSEYSKYAGLVKKFVIDSNALAQEKALEATLAFVENAAVAGKTCADVVAGVVTKCLNARAKTKEGGIAVCLMYVEIEQQAVVQEEIMKGLSNKQPKIVLGSIQVLKMMLQEFGVKVMNMKLLMKALPTMFENSDKNVRAEAKALATEVYRWIGAAVKPSLEKSLKPVQLKELEEAWGALPGEPAVPTRLLRSQQQSQAAAVPVGGGGGGGGSEASGGGAPMAAEPVDPYEFLDPVDLLEQMPKNFYEQLASVKWKERKEVLEALLPHAQSPKLQKGDYGELVKALKKVITKDSNVMIVAVAGNIVTGLAKGLRKAYLPYAAVTMAGIFDKFKEKKQNVVTSLREAADAVYLTTTLGGIQDEVVEALGNKNPSVKTEVLLFLSRCFQQCTPALLPKPLLKAFCPLVVQKLDDTNPQVREAGCEALGTLLKVVGERPLNTHLENVDKSKMAKIQEHRDAVELKIQTGVIASPIAKPQATSKSQPVASKPPPVSTAGGEEEGGGGDSLMISFDEPSKPVKRKPPVLSSQRKKAAAKEEEEEPPKSEVSGEGSSLSLSFDEPSKPMKKKPQLSSERRTARKKEEGESPKKDEDAEESSSLSVSFDEPSKPVKKKPALSSQKKAAAQKKTEEEESGSPSATPESKPKQPAPAKKKPPAKAGGGRGGKGKGGGAGKTDEPPDQPEPAISAEEVDEKAAEVLPGGLMDQLAHTNWKERLAACERFKEFVEGLPGAEMQSHLFVKVLAKKPGWKDSNFQVMKAKLGIVALLAERAGIFGKRSTSCAMPALVEKLADVKVKPQCIEALMTMAERLTLNFISLQVMKLAFEHKSPKVQSEALEWLGQAIKEFGFLINVKPHVDFIKKAFGASNPAVRTSAINLLGVMHMYIGAQLRVFFEEEKAALLQQIDAAFEKVSGESPPAPTRGPNVGGEEDEEEGGEGGGGAQAAVSLADLMPKVDISGQIKSDIIKELGDKNWKIRGEALQKVQGIISAAKFIQPSLGELPGALKGRLADSNKNLVITTLNIISSLASSMGSSCSKFTRAFMPGTLGVLVDAKPHVRAAAIACLNAWHTELTLTPFVEQELISTALANENPNLRAELLGWLEEKLPGAGKLPPEVSAIIPPLFSCLEDRSGDVRKKGQAVLPLFMAKVGYDTMLKHTGKLKPASKQVVKGLLDKHRSAAPPPQQPPAKAKQSPSSSEGAAAKEKEKEKPEKSAPPSSGKKAPSKAGSAAKGKSGRQKGGASAAEEAPSPPLVVVQNGKEQRMKDEEKMKTLKWNFALPRSEHIEQLKEQLQPCVSSTLYTQLFHDDFKQHITALGTLTKCVSGDSPYKEAAISCLDLLLRWVTLRFFDTNTTVNLKCLEFLAATFQMLVQHDNYRMSDYEAGAFLPYLVQKVGDSKDAVRKGVRSLFRELCSFYPPTKLFGFVLDGLKSKNARQRTECLEELGLLIQNNGMLVCGSQPKKTVPLIAAQITDRDNAVRSAALNAMVTVYGNTGEDVFKFTTQLSEKDISLLEEKIRRYGKKPQTVTPAPSEASTATTTAASSSSAGGQEEGGEKQKLKVPGSRLQAPSGALKPSSSTEAIPEPEQALPSSSSSERLSPPLPTQEPPKPQPPPAITGPFKMNMQTYVSPSVASRFTNGALKLETADTKLLKDQDLERPKFAASSLLAHPPSPVSVSPARMASTAATINFIISQITSSDKKESCKALRQMEVVMSQPSQRMAVIPHVNQLLRTVLMQMKLNFTTPLASANDPQSLHEVMDLGKNLTSCLVTVFSEPTLAHVASQECLIEVERDIMGYLVDERLLKLEDIAQLIRSFNYLMLRLCENCNKTALFGSLLQVLLKSVNPDGSSTKLTEMTMKCIWKITRQLPQLLSSLNLDQLLYDVHLFFQGYTQLVPSPTPEDTPYRTVKTILFHLTNLVGTEVMDHLTLIKDVKQSRVTQYVRKTLAKKRLSVEKSSEETARRGGERSAASSTDRERTGEASRPVPSSLQNYKPHQPTVFVSDSLPPGSSAVLTEIFKKISAPQTTKEGLLNLYRFKQQNPGIDFSSFYKTSSKFYQAYIERGLRGIESELLASGGVDGTARGAAPLSGSALANSLGSDEHREHMKTMKSIRLRASRLMNIDEWDSKSEKHSVLPTSAAVTASDVVPGSIRTEGTQQEPRPDENKLSLSKSRLQVPAQPKPPGAPKPSMNLDDIKRRLDRLKGST